jgi:hypothetical protein
MLVLFRRQRAKEPAWFYDRRRVVGLRAHALAAARGSGRDEMNGSRLRQSGVLPPEWRSVTRQSRRERRYLLIAFSSLSLAPLEVSLLVDQVIRRIDLSHLLLPLSYPSVRPIGRNRR